ncbi:hypothetical protein [Bosea sp. BIWAKO-01]|uniref:hypothetical protein n=1 Tax=Bosea sp. BIWAKO-01 TaxID=506668 RepID=UPI00114CF452|nr:hypothetical protein [Bosea sp. BIWAKO-01]
MAWLSARIIDATLALGGECNVPDLLGWKRDPASISQAVLKHLIEIIIRGIRSQRECGLVRGDTQPSGKRLERMGRVFFQEAEPYRHLVPGQGDNAIGDFPQTEPRIHGVELEAKIHIVRRDQDVMNPVGGINDIKACHANSPSSQIFSPRCS